MPLLYALTEEFILYAGRLQKKKKDFYYEQTFIVRRTAKIDFFFFLGVDL